MLSDGCAVGLALDWPAASFTVSAGVGASSPGRAVIDPNVAINTGAGTNQDTVLMFRRDDIWIWESQMRAEAFEQPYADSMGILFRCFNYSAMVPDRYLSSLGQLVGTGLVTPVFAS